MNKKFLSAFLFGALMVTSTGTFVSCKDYDDDIDQINATLGDLKSQLSALQAKVDAGKYVTNVATTADGITITLNDGSSYPITNGKDGAPGAEGKPGTNGENGKDGDKISINEEGYFVLNGEVQPWKAVTKDEMGQAVKIKAPTMAADGTWVFYNEKGEPQNTTWKVAPVTAVQDAEDLSWTLTVYAADGSYQTIKLPTASSLLTELDLLGWATVSDPTTDFPESSIKDGKDNNKLTVKYKYIPKIVKAYDGNKETTWSAQKDVVKKQVLTTLSPLGTKLVARIAPTSVDWADFSFTLQDSKGSKLPITLKTAEAFTGTLTRAAANSSIGFIPLDVVTTTYNSGDAYKNLFNRNANNSLYSLVETSGYRSDYGIEVVAEDAGNIEEQKVTKVDPQGTTANENKGDGTESNAFIIDLNTPTRLVFGSNPEYVYDYYVEPKDPKVAAEFGFSTDKKAGTITMTKASDLVSKAGMELLVYALHIDGQIYRASVWVKPSSILSTGVVLKAGNQTINPILDGNGVIDANYTDQTSFTVSLNEMFGKMTQTDKDRWLSVVMGANAGAKVVSVKAAGEAPEAKDYSIVYLDKDGKKIKDNENNKAVALRVYAKYAKNNKENKYVAVLTPEKEYTMTVNFKHKESDNSESVLNTVKVTFTPVLPDLTTFLAKKTGYWNDNILMAYFDDPTNKQQKDNIILESEFTIKKGFSKFGKADANGTAIATITLGLDNNQKLSDNKAIKHDDVSAATITADNVINLNTDAWSSTKVRAYNENMDVIVAIKYLGVYDYKETDTYKAQLKKANFQINVQSALIAGDIKALGSKAIIMKPAAAGDIWKLTAEHVSGYTYSDSKSTPYNIFKQWLLTPTDKLPEYAAKYKYTYIKSVTFSSVDTDYYVITDQTGDAVSADINKKGVSAIDPVADANDKNKEGIASYLPLKSVNTTEHIETTLKVTVTDMYGYSREFYVPLEISPASK